MHPIYSHYQKPFLKPSLLLILLNYFHILHCLIIYWKYSLKTELTRWNILIINNEMGKRLLLRFVSPVQIHS